MKQLNEKQAFLLFLEHYGIQTSLSLGQNFLYDSKVLEMMAKEVCNQKFSWVFELGAGTGNLTHALLDKTERLVSVEVDKKLHTLLQKRFEKNEHLRLLLEDARTLNYRKLLEEEGTESFAVCGNLPYYITTELILLLCTELKKAKQFLFLVQEEACDRICLHYGSKSYGPLSIFLSNFFEIERLQKLPASAFVPAPKVDSRFLRLRPSEKMQEREKECTLAYYQFLKQLFQNRRKKLSHQLKHTPSLFEKSLEEMLAFLEEKGYKDQVRAEEIKPEDWFAFYKFCRKETNFV